jgi:hypothetical protein
MLSGQMMTAQGSNRDYVSIASAVKVNWFVKTRLTHFIQETPPPAFHNNLINGTLRVQTLHMSAQTNVAEVTHRKAVQPIPSRMMIKFVLQC